MEVDTNKHAVRKKSKRIPQEKVKTTENQTKSQKSHQKDTNLVCHHRKLHANIHKVNERRTLPIDKRTWILMMMH